MINLLKATLLKKALSIAVLCSFTLSYGSAFATPPGSNQSIYTNPTNTNSSTSTQAVTPPANNTANNVQQQTNIQVLITRNDPPVNPVVPPGGPAPVNPVVPPGPIVAPPIPTSPGPPVPVSTSANVNFDDTYNALRLSLNNATGTAAIQEAQIAMVSFAMLAFSAFIDGNPVGTEGDAARKKIMDDIRRLLEKEGRRRHPSSWVSDERITSGVEALLNKYKKAMDEYFKALSGMCPVCGIYRGPDGNVTYCDGNGHCTTTPKNIINDFLKGRGEPTIP